MEPEILIDVLVQLAGLESETAGCRARLAHGERVTEQLMGLDQEYADDAADADLRRQQTHVRQHSAERDLAALEETLARKRGQLASAADARSAEALRKEIATVVARQEALLEEACRLLDQEDRRGEESAQATEEQLAQQRKAAAELRRIAADREQTAAALPEIEAEIRRLADLLPEGIRRHLQRLWDRGDTGVVFVRDAACGVCGARLTPQQDLAVKRGREVVRCAACARFVVHRPWR